MNINDFVILPGSKTGTSVRLKTRTVRELQLEKVQLERETKEMEKKLQQLQSNMTREKEERKKLSPYHWKSGQAGPMTIQAQIFSQCKENWKKISSGKVKLQILKEQEPVKEPFKVEKGKAVAHKKPEVKGIACGLSEMESMLLDAPSESTGAGLGNLDKGLLLNGVFNEEESAKSFQEALLQWRKGNGEHGEQLQAREALPDSVGVGEVQTNVTVLKEPIHVEFQKDGLSYMEKLLLKKYRRTPVDQISDSCMKDLRPVQTLSVHQAVTGDADDMDDLLVDEMKRLWASVFRVEEANPVSESAESESSLKVEYLDDSYSMDLEEPSNCSVVESGAVGMNEQGKVEPLEQRARNPVSSDEISQGKMVVCSDLERNAVQKESIKAESRRRSLSSYGFPEVIYNAAERMSNKLLEKELQKNREESQELGSVCKREGLALPGINKSSALQNVARRQKPVSTCYQGLEGFFVVGANPEQGILEAHSSLCAASSPRDSSIPFPGVGQWVSERSLSEYAADSVVQGVLKTQLNRTLNDFKAQNKISPLMGTWSSCPGPEKRHSLTFEHVTSPSRHLEKICRNASDFQENLQLKDHDTVDILGDWDESQMDDEEEILEDKQQVLALQ